MKRTIAALALLAMPLAASASVVYTANGGPYTSATAHYTTSMGIRNLWRDGFILDNE